ncbi:MAG: hypothetical protein V1734_03440 [Nanoarchaeota archaeon]
MRNRYNHGDNEDKHSLADKICMGVAVLGLSGMAAQYIGACEPANPKIDNNAVPRDNIVYVDRDADGDIDSEIMSKSGVAFELKYDEKGNPYIERKAFSFKVDMNNLDYKGQKQAALEARSR